MKLSLTFLLLFFAAISFSSALAGSFMVVYSEEATSPTRVNAPIDFPREDYRITVTYKVYLNEEAVKTIGESDLSPICDRYGDGRAYYSGGFQKSSVSGPYYDSISGREVYKRTFKLNCTIYKKSAVWNGIYTLTAERYTELANDAYTRYRSERRWYKRMRHLVKYFVYTKKARQHSAIAKRYL